jgi:hypothetical protein
VVLPAVRSEAVGVSQPLTAVEDRHGRTYDAAWRRKRDRYVKKMKSRCEECGADGRIEAHHRDPLGSDDDDNLQALCPSCHRTAEMERTVSINVMKVTLADALLIVRQKYASHPGALRG